MKIGLKKTIALGILGLVLLPVLSGVIGIYQQKKIKQSENLLIENNVKKDLISHFVNKVTFTTLGYMDAIVDKDSYKVAEEIKEKHKKMSDYFLMEKEKLKKIIIEVSDEKTFEEIEKRMVLYLDSGASLIKTIEDKHLEKISDFDDHIDIVNSEIDALGKKVEEKLLKDFEVALADMKKTESLSFTISIAIMIFSVVFGVSVGLYLISKMNQDLNKAIKSIGDSTVTVLRSSKVFDRLGIDLSTSMQQQAESLQETASAIEEINQTVAKNAESAEYSEKYAVDCVESADRGKVAVVDMANIIKKIEQDQKNILEILNKTNLDVEEMADIIKNINEKTKIINDIVFQTKLLSFNASVEAARAGETGKGFAVVAEEVGNLATMSGNAAREINEILTMGNTKVTKIVEVMTQNIAQMKKESIKNISESENSVNICKDRLEDIILKISELKEMATSIARSSKEQSVGVQEITKAINELDQLTEKNTGMSKECAAQAEVMGENSHTLETTIHDLRVAIDGEQLNQSNA